MSSSPYSASDGLHQDTVRTPPVANLNELILDSSDRWLQQLTVRLDSIDRAMRQIDSGSTHYPVDDSLQLQLQELRTQVVRAARELHISQQQVQELAGNLADARQRTKSLTRELSHSQQLLSEARSLPGASPAEIARMDLLASAFHNATEGAAVLTADGTIVEANPRFIEMFDSGPTNSPGLTNILAAFGATFSARLQQVSGGKTWSGKIPTHQVGLGQRWYWVSLGPNRCEGTKEPHIIALFSDVTQLEDSQQILKQQALHDNLTGLPNRRYFRNYVDELVCNQSNAENSFTVCFLDLDDFKGVNDSLGHGTGDELLVEVARRLSTAIGHNAFIARFGGDEFAAVFPKRRDRDLNIDDSIQSLFAAFMDPILLGANEVAVGLSLGIATYPQDGLDADSLMSCADIAMYSAKAAGKNQVCSFDSKMQQQVDHRHFMRSELRTVLDGGGISLAFQPKVCAHTGAMRGCEALARWQRPDGSMVSPAEFIPIAEQSGTILALGELVISQALETCAAWTEQQRDLFPVAINISPQQLRSVHFVDRLMALLAEFGGSPHWIELEFTENAIVENIKHAIETIDQLRALGFKIAIDDFGTGYSSLGYLRFFGIDTLKIDKSFVSEVATDRNCAAIANSIISLGKGLDLTIVAEGVETAQQQQYLAQAGCDLVQGYLVGRPMAKVDIEQWLERRLLSSDS
ncbi:putative bifunctional diguanylate cyclase/phosphodiesterase [Aureliella helgolandensis]|uniref:Cyclic di-GMP phosphodiesterase Gmr n=1 Tax=Aureliella helgolandensis TaxID=2527968 RepID=A0A518G6B3_9BACT|nr:EAL domain-containing protein [Aureliella helgolandensis]QDV24125.1 Cyclic di-GMP phosphodiesterase Gmr [Aureliella helgolandensis]